MVALKLQAAYSSPRTGAARRCAKQLARAAARALPGLSVPPLAVTTEMSSSGDEAQVRVDVTIGDDCEEDVKPLVAASLLLFGSAVQASCTTKVNARTARPMLSKPVWPVGAVLHVHLEGALSPEEVGHEMEFLDGCFRVIDLETKPSSAGWELQAEVTSRRLGAFVAYGAAMTKAGARVYCCDPYVFRRLGRPELQLQLPPKQPRRRPSAAA